MVTKMRIAVSVGRCSLAVGLILGIVLAQGCATPPKRQPPPEDQYEQARIAGIPKARYWGDEVPPFAEDMAGMSPDELQTRYPALVNRPMTLLAISGGGSNGAFTSGLLNGWTAAGTRPRNDCDRSATYVHTEQNCWAA